MAHISEEDLELYAMRMLPEADLERIEKHLLTCVECQDRLIETEASRGRVPGCCGEEDSET